MNLDPSQITIMGKMSTNAPYVEKVEVSLIELEEEPKIHMPLKKDQFKNITNLMSPGISDKAAFIRIYKDNNIVGSAPTNGGDLVISSGKINEQYSSLWLETTIQNFCASILNSRLDNHKSILSDLHSKLCGMSVLKNDGRILINNWSAMNLKLAKQKDIRSSLFTLCCRKDDLLNEEQKFHLAHLLHSTEQQTLQLLRESQALINKMSAIVNNTNDDPQINEEEEVDNSDTIPTPPPYFKVFDTDEDSDEFYEEASRITGMSVDQLKKMPKKKYDSLDDLCRDHGLSPKDIQEAGGIIPVPKCKHNSNSTQKGIVIGDNPAIMGQIPAKSNTKSNGMNCNSCNEFNPYAEPNVGDVYVCYSCQNY